MTFSTKFFQQKILCTTLVISAFANTGNTIKNNRNPLSLTLPLYAEMPDCDVRESLYLLLFYSDLGEFQQDAASHGVYHSTDAISESSMKNVLARTRLRDTTSNLIETNSGAKIQSRGFTKRHDLQRLMFTYDEQATVKTAHKSGTLAPTSEQNGRRRP